MFNVSKIMKIKRKYVVHRYFDLIIILIDHNLRYADDTTLMAESEKELKSLLIQYL